MGTLRNDRTEENRNAQHSANGATLEEARIFYDAMKELTPEGRKRALALMNEKITGSAQRATGPI